MSKPQLTRIGCYGVLTYDSKILLCRICGGLLDQGKWTLPGGGMDFGETLEETVIREVREETGLEIVVGPLIRHNSRLLERENDRFHFMQFIFLATRVGGELKNEVDGSTDLVEWVDLASIAEENSVDIVHWAVETLTRPSYLREDDRRNG